MIPPDKKTQIEDRVNTGLLGQWYPVGKPVEINSSRPHGVKLPGHKLAL